MRRLAGQDDPDLAVLGRVVVHRDHLIDRNSQLPTELLPVSAALGHLDRAESLADTLANGDRNAGEASQLGNVVAVIELARAAMAAGEHDRAHRLVAKADELARSITRWGPETGVLSDPWTQASALARVAVALEALGQPGRARAMASTLRGKINKITVLTGRVMNALAAGEHDRASRLAGEAEALARTLTFTSTASGSGDHREETGGWISVAGAMAALGEPGRAIDFTRSLPRSNQIDKVNALTGLAEALAATGNSDWLSRLAEHAQSLISTLDPGTLSHPGYHAQTLARLAAAAGADGDRDRVIALIADFEARARSIDDATRAPCGGKSCRNWHKRRPELATSLTPACWGPTQQLSCATACRRTAVHRTTWCARCWRRASATRPNTSPAASPTPPSGAPARWPWWPKPQWPRVSPSRPAGSWLARMKSSAASPTRQTRTGR
jgi:tetratricopeptide (TPR) repeat protein